MARDLREASRAGRRREIAIASIINLRAEIGYGAHEAFGQFLGSMRISHPVPDDISVDALARDIHRETVRFKLQKLYLQTMLAVQINGMVWSFLNLGQRQRLYAKTYPVLAGLTSLNVDALWDTRATNGTVPEYLRAVPTGPVAPLVIAATSADAALALGLSYRRSAIASFLAQTVCSMQ